MAQNDILVFAGSGAANVITQAEYAGLTALVDDGFISGTALSARLNKVWRQSSIMSGMIAQFIVDQTGNDVVDNGTAGVAAIEASFVTALQNAVAASGIPWGDDTGSANSIVADVTPAPGSLAEGLTVAIKVIADNTGPVTLNLQSFGIKNVSNADGTPLSAGEVNAAGYALFVYDGTKFQMMSMPGPAFFASLLASASYTAVDVGAANALVANLSVPPATLGDVQYIPLSIKVANANTAAATLNLNSLGATPIVNPDGSPLAPGQLAASMTVLVFDGTNFILTATSGPRFLQAGSINFATAGGTGNALTLTLNPAPVALVAGMPIRFKATAVNTGAATINVNALGAVAITNSAGTALTGGEIIAFGLYELLFDGTAARMTSTPSNLGGAGRQVGVVVLSASGNYTPSAGVSKIQVEVVGAGGGGGGAAATGGSTVAAGAGGGAGAYAMVEFPVSGLSPPIAYAVGVGGVGNSGAAGSAGTSTTFGTAGALITAPGGQGGATTGAVANATSRTAAGGAPASISTQAGGSWSRLSGGTPGQPGITTDSSGAFVTGGGGAPGPWGGGGGAAVPGGGVHAPGSAATGPGGGGGGAINQTSGSAQVGGDGHAGEIVIREYS